MVNDKVLHGLLDSKLNEIAESISENWSRVDKNCGMFSGHSGIVLFLLYYKHYSQNEKYGDIANQILEDIFHSVNKLNRMSLYIADGVSGLFSTLFHLQEYEIIDKHFFDYNANLDEIIFKRILNELKLRNYDFFYGNAGLLFFLYKRLKSEPNNEELSQFIKNIIDILSHYLQINKNYFAFHKRNDGVVNFGTPHGITSWILILCKIEEKFPYRYNITPLVESIIQPLLHCTKKTYGNSYFPDTLDLSIPNGTKLADYNSRLAWCYGDLLCAISLASYSKLTNIEELNHITKSIILNCSQRINLKKNHIRDAGICHGSAGLVTIFCNIDRKMSDIIQTDLSETINYWLEQTLKFSRYRIGFAGYCSATFTGKRYKPQPRLDFIAGTSGIGLSMIGFMKKELSSWDEFLLLP